MGLKSKIKTELGFMAKGAKVLPSYAVKKTREGIKARMEEGRLVRQVEREAEVEAKKVALEKYKTEYSAALAAEYSKKAAAKARAKVSGNSGGMGILGQLGQVGRNLEDSDIVGINEFRQRAAAPRQSATSVLFDGMPTFQQRPQHRRHKHGKRR